MLIPTDAEKITVMGEEAGADAPMVELAANGTGPTSTMYLIARKFYKCDRMNVNMHYVFQARGSVRAKVLCRFDVKSPQKLWTI